MKIAIIPARGGSKRIKKKNIRKFNGRPIIFWAIKAAKESGLFDKIVVSTDSTEIAEIAKRFGAEIPFIRPDNISDDFSPTIDVIAHTIDSIEDKDKLEYACCIYPCSPFLQKEDLKKAFNLLVKSNSDYVYPVTEFPPPPQRSLRMNEESNLSFTYPENEMKRTQDFETLYHDAGQFYWGKKSAWVNKINMHSSGIGLPVPNWRVIDIDNEEDWKRAELLFQIMDRKT